MTMTDSAAPTATPNATVVNGTIAATSDGSNPPNYSFAYGGDCYNPQSQSYDFRHVNGPIQLNLTLNAGTTGLNFQTDSNNDGGDAVQFMRSKDYPNGSWSLGSTFDGNPFDDFTLSGSVLGFTDKNSNGHNYHFCCLFTDANGNKVQTDPQIMNKGG